MKKSKADRNARVVTLNEIFYHLTKVNVKQEKLKLGKQTHTHTPVPQAGVQESLQLKVTADSSKSELTVPEIKTPKGLQNLF